MNSYSFLNKTETDGNNKITSWNSAGMSREKIINPYKSDTDFSLEYDPSYRIVTFNPNKAGIFEGIFFWGGLIT